MLKDMIQSDVAMLFNPAEFGEVHMVNGREIVCIVDSNNTDNSAGQSSSAEFGVNTARITLFINEKDFKGKLSANSMLLLDNKHYIVEACAQNMGVFEIILSQNNNG